MFKRHRKFGIRFDVHTFAVDKIVDDISAVRLVVLHYFDGFCLSQQLSRLPDLCHCFVFLRFDKTFCNVIHRLVERSPDHSRRTFYLFGGVSVIRHLFIIDESAERNVVFVLVRDPVKICLAESTAVYLYRKRERLEIVQILCRLYIRRIFKFRNDLFTLFRSVVHFGEFFDAFSVMEFKHSPSDHVCLELLRLGIVTIHPCFLQDKLKRFEFLN